MLYVDYVFDLAENTILFDSELKLSGQCNDNKWGNLPETWKEGDVFELKVTPNNRVVLQRKTD